MFGTIINLIMVHVTNHFKGSAATGTRSAAYGELLLARYAAVQPDIAYTLNNGV